MSSLVPEVRIDVNGRHVTRHVKPSTTPPSLLRSIPSPHLYSEEFSSSFENAQAVAGLVFSFTEDEQMIDANGNEVHDYGFEEAVDAMSEMLSSKTLIFLKQKLEHANGRLKVILAEQVCPEIADFCHNRQSGTENSPPTLSTRSSVHHSIRIAPMADDFAASDAELSKVLSSIYNSTRSVRRECSSPEWKAILKDDGKRDRMIESEFVVNYVTNSRVGYEKDHTPREIFDNRMQIMDNYERVKKHQNEFAKRGVIDVGILDELDKISAPIRDGSL